jgi:hypothetical protein
VGPPGRIAGRFGVNHDDLAHRGPSAAARLALGHSDRLRPLRLAFSSVTWGMAVLRMTNRVRRLLSERNIASDRCSTWPNGDCQEACVWGP